MTSCAVFKVNASLFFVFLYVALYVLVDRLGLNATHYGPVSFFFLPAIVRLVAFLIVGFWTVPVLFIAGAICVAAGWYDLGPGNAEELIITALTSIGAPLGTYAVLRYRKIRADLFGLSGWDLIWLSAGCAFGNALFLWFGYAAIGRTEPWNGLLVSVFLGDAVGVWIMMLMLKAILRVIGKWIGPVIKMDDGH